MATSTNDTQSALTAASASAGVSPATASRNRVTHTARGLLVGGMLLMGTGLGLGAAFADNDNDTAEQQENLTPERVTETVTLHVETTTVTATPEVDAGEAPAEPEVIDTEPAPAPAQPVTGRHAELTSGDSYAVERGDTMATIAARAGVSLDALIKANPGVTDPNLIYKGNIITIP